ncbi:MAG: hypothetical protein DCF12_08220 [Snowella sp.]|nr:MAG: hypothetical protein DCF12_08220 [Snowella sp.]
MKKAIALVYIPTKYSTLRQTLDVKTLDKRHRAKVVKNPFIGLRTNLNSVNFSLKSINFLDSVLHSSFAESILVL